jgi:hypothetical protein
MDIMNFEILEDGTITVKTSDISDGNHMSADNLIMNMADLMGGKMTYKGNKEAQAHAHIHRHGVAHTHR